MEQAKTKINIKSIQKTWMLWIDEAFKYNRLKDFLCEKYKCIKDDEKETRFIIQEEKAELYFTKEDEFVAGRENQTADDYTFVEVAHIVAQDPLVCNKVMNNIVSDREIKNHISSADDLGIALPIYTNKGKFSFHNIKYPSYVFTPTQSTSDIKEIKIQGKTLPKSKDDLRIKYALNLNIKRCSDFARINMDDFLKQQEEYRNRQDKSKNFKFSFKFKSFISQLNHAVLCEFSNLILTSAGLHEDISFDIKSHMTPYMKQHIKEQTHEEDIDEYNYSSEYT